MLNFKFAKQESMPQLLKRMHTRAAEALCAAQAQQCQLLSAALAAAFTFAKVPSF
jgi:hypothetical protein